MRQYRLLQAIPLSFFSAALYQDVAQRWRGLGFSYLFILLLLISSITAVTSSVKVVLFDIEKQLNVFYDNAIKTSQINLEDVINSGLDMLSQLPPVTFKEGKATSDVPQPYYITEPITQKKVFIIDTTGQTTSLEGTESHILLTANAFITKKDDNREEVRYITAAKDDEQRDLTTVWNTLEQLPVIRIENGEAKTDVTQPYFIKNPETQGDVAAIDTTGELTSLKGSTLQYLLTDHALYYKSTNKDGVQEDAAFDLKNLKEENLVLLLHNVAPTLKKILIMILLFFIPVSAFFKFVPLLLGMLLLGLCGLLFMTLLKVQDTKYEVSVRLASIASTPAIVAHAFLPLSTWVCTLVAMVYLFFAIMTVNRGVSLSTPPSVSI